MGVLIESATAWHCITQNHVTGGESSDGPRLVRLSCAKPGRERLIGRSLFYIREADKLLRFKTFSTTTAPTIAELVC